MIVASVAAPDTHSAIVAARACAGLAGLVEFRLDRIGSPDPAALVEGSPLPVIAACPLETEGGAFLGNRGERAALLRAAAAAGARYVDVDHRAASDLRELPPETRRVISSHDFAGTPERISPLVFESLAAAGGIPKYVTTARCAEDGLRVLRALREWGGRGIAFAMGEEGAATRALAPLFGSIWTYAAAEVPTAPGQWSVAELRATFPPAGPSPRTLVFGVLGRPIGHSLSPAVHRAALRAAGFDAIFLPFSPFRLADFLALLEDHRFAGLGVTAPFKLEAARLAARRSPEVEACGAANTLVRGAEGWEAHNTDGDAAAEAIEEEGGRGLEGARVLVLGCGGAARGIALACRARGAAVLLAGRSPDRVASACSAVGAEPIPWEGLASAPHDVLVQATPVGTRDPEALLVPPGAVRPGTVVLDVVYDPPETALLSLARERGARGIGGIEMFWRQASAQFRLFTGAEPPRELFRAAAHAALRRRAGK
ncbi:MAG TPA: type I 3-dehydroquinate dehydratase [Planctomycetota bacterium]|jgi:3-dehydroquinate dehydratase/shikimate dehydrogenase|nr:type I 3-dehydroquinate dehydratase [Planctomycetota bacterium]